MNRMYLVRSTLTESKGIGRLTITSVIPNSSTPEYRRVIMTGDHEALERFNNALQKDGIFLLEDDRLTVLSKNSLTIKGEITVVDLNKPPETPAP